MASAAARLTSSGPSKSGKPWLRLIAPCRWASPVISVKIEVPKGRMDRLTALSSVNGFGKSGPHAALGLIDGFGLLRTFEGYGQHHLAHIDQYRLE